MAVEKIGHISIGSANMVERHKVAVIGAGLAGLSAARRLRSYYASVDDVLVLEASSRIGGRVKNVEGLAPWPIEAGAEFIHGSNSRIKKIVDEIGCAQTEHFYPDHYYLGKEDQLLTRAEALQNPYVREAHAAFSRLPDADLEQPDMSIFEYMQSKHASHRSIQLADCFYANDFGCSIYELGLQECIHEARSWSYGDEYILLDRPLSSVVEFLAEGLNIRINSPVYKIEYSKEDGVTIFGSNNAQLIVADYAIVTVPLTVLQRQMIDFVPSLPETKKNAINAIGMRTALKVILAFSGRFWPDFMFHVLCSECFLPEIWSTVYPSCPVSKQTAATVGRHVLVGFVAGPAADAAAALPQSDIFRRALMQLDAMFKGFQGRDETCSSREDCFQNDEGDCPGRFYTRNYLFKDVGVRVTPCPLQRPASTLFTGGCIVNWGEEPYIYGGYTHPSIGALGARETLGKCVEDRMFFAGEATHAGVNPCMDGAIESGLRAAEEIIVKEDANANANLSKL